MKPREFDMIRYTDRSPKILKEVIKTIKNSKHRKFPRIDQVHIEIIKLLEENNMVELFNLIYSTGVIPRGCLRSEFIPIPKK